MSQQIVVIVQEGTWGDVTQAEKDRDAEMFKRVLETPTPRYSLSGGGPREEQRASVEIVPTVDAARQRLKTYPHVDVLVLNSRSMIPDARAFKREFSRLKVIVITGVIPQEEILLIDRGWLSGGENSIVTMQDIILDTRQGR